MSKQQKPGNRKQISMVLVCCFLAINSFRSSSPEASRQHTSNAKESWAAAAAEIVTPDTCPLHSLRSAVREPVGAGSKSLSCSADVESLLGGEK